MCSKALSGYLNKLIFTAVLLTFYLKINGCWKAINVRIWLHWPIFFLSFFVIK